MTEQTVSAENLAPKDGEQVVQEVQKSNVLKLPVPQEYRVFTNAQTWGEFFDFEMTSKYIFRVTINARPKVTDTPANEPASPTTNRLALYVGQQLALGYYEKFSPNLFVQKFDRSRQRVEGIAMALAYGRWFEGTWDKSHNAIVPYYDEAPAGKALKADIANLIATGIPVLVKPAAFQPLVASIYKTFMAPDLETARKMREDHIEQNTKSRQLWQKAQREYEAQDCMVIVASDEAGHELNLVAEGTCYWEVLISDGDSQKVFENRQLRVDHIEDRRYFQMLVANGMIFRKLGTDSPWKRAKPAFDRSLPKINFGW